VAATAAIPPLGHGGYRNERREAMSRRTLLYSTWTLSALVATACGGRVAAPGRPTASSQVIAPDAIRDFSVL
jgi:hypothetical protein